MPSGGCILKSVLDSVRIYHAINCSHRYHKNYRIDPLPLKKSGIFCDITGKPCDEKFGEIPDDCPLPKTFEEKIGVKNGH